ncbi:sulfatase family protein [Hydrogenophaga sp. BPS33]|uniref:sulfatase family protein n=1 Tax=Hydrogenophaga sp. BPS33 TaxID=2651974 RepID=UPI00131F6CDC|nr:sulfatase-like hydrolase/transferase [Hydrogenophaga sp. BPS33]QHE85492.1 sulfatase-like hydrolase/transferase [Hydrogenophaga sp. BPS33]
MTRKRPNFLLFITDQHRADHLGCYGNAEVRTPHIDALAAQGCRFDHFHVATPICQPNRASLMTGRLPSVHGLQMNGRELSLGERTFVETLRASGYQTALVGKCHLQNITTIPPLWPSAAQRRPQDALQPFPGRYGQEVWKRWEDDPTFELDLPYYGFEQARLTIGHADEQHGHWRRWLREQTPDADQLIGPDNAIPTPGLQLAKLRQAWRTRVPEELYPTAYIATQTCEQLARLAREDQPFFVQCSFPDPHHPFTPPGRYWDMFRPQDVSLPASFNAELTNPPPPVPWLREQRRANPAFRPGYGSFACSEQEVREALALNHGSLAHIDDSIGRVMAQLRALGLDDNTVVMFTSDHGDLLGERGLMFKGGLHYPALTRVPFIWRDGAQASANAASSALTQTIDIAATVLERAGLPAANGMQGSSLLPVIRGDATEVRTQLLIEEESQRSDFGMDRRVRMRTLRDHQHRLTVYDGQPWGELYDLGADPLELRNLWDETASLPLRRELMERLARAMLSAVDDSPYPGAAA